MSEQLARQLPNWLSAYGQYTEDTESPASFHVWTALWVLAGALRRKVWIEAGHFNIYPNLYVLLVAPPGKARKTAAISIGTKFLEKLKVPLVADNITREALIRQAAESIQLDTAPEGLVYTHNSLSLASPEFVVFMGQNNFQMIDLLTDWFDCKSPWRYITKGQGVDEIEGLFFNMLGAATSEGLGSHLPEASIGGGFTSRIVFVVERDKRKSVAFPELTAEQRRVGELLHGDLRYIADRFFGPMRLTDGAKAFYKSWYDSDDRNKLIADVRMAPYLERKPLHVLKVAMLIHVAIKDSMEIDEEDIDYAIKMLNMIEPQMPEAFNSVGLNKNAGVQSRIYQHIAQFKHISFEDLMTAFWRDVENHQMVNILETLTQMGSVRTKLIGTTSVYWSTKKGEAS